MNGNNEYFNALMSYSLFTIVTFISLYKCHQSLPQPLKQTEKDCSNSSSTSLRAVRKKPSISIFYGTCTGTARIFAQKLSSEIFDACNIMIEATDLKDFDEEKIQNGGIIFIILSTISDGNAPESAQAFVSWLNDLAFDFRISKDFLSKIKFAVFGLGGQVYGENFCLAARNVNEYLLKLGAYSLHYPTYGDDASDLESLFESWSINIVKIVSKIENSKANTKLKDSIIKNKNQSVINKEKVVPIKNLPNVEKAPKIKKAIPKSIMKSNTNPVPIAQENANMVIKVSGNGLIEGQTTEEDDVDEDEEDRINQEFITMDNRNDYSDDENGSFMKDVESGCGDGIEHDLEDLTSKPMKLNSSVDSSSAREMVTKLQRKALTKEGYRIIGSHSAVKLCRWTKNQMRGRGGCYKHTCYGITSYQCMEATPSLACANKCVFCWRHHKNPVGTEWRWKTDDPHDIVSDAIRLHQTMINEMRGVPGVLLERLQEAFTVKHCALSLVGEPIIYPRINELLRDLHSRKISSFLVTNGQFPDSITNLDPVTQLYVSVDASTRDSMKAVDRPLFKDFWERFLASLKELSLKKQRTVYRMTLVNNWNMDQLEEYVELIEFGQPDFIEVKSVTYCGKSDASTLTMSSVPWHREVCDYCDRIVDLLQIRKAAGKGSNHLNLPKVDYTKMPVYSIAAEHEHSCLVLLAREDKFKISDKWYTWIDYDKFDQLIQAYYDSNGMKTFASEDYLAPTPSWALYKSMSRGFDPVENRWRRNKQGNMVEIEYRATESGCG